MGSMNPDDENYFTCHLTIKVPSEGERNTVLYMVLFSLLGALALFIYWRVKTSATQISAEKGREEKESKVFGK